MSPSRWGFAILLLAGLSACASRARRGDPAITEADLHRHLEHLSSERLHGRQPGTPGFDSAAAYVARVLANAGVTAVLQPGYLQPVPMVHLDVGPGTVLELRTGHTVERLPHDQRSFLLLAPGNGGVQPLSLPPVFVGRGLHAPDAGVDDLAGLDLEGRAVLLAASPPSSAELAALPEAVRRRYGDRRAAQAQRVQDLTARGAASLLLLPDRWLVDEWDELRAERQRVDYAPVESYAGGPVHSPVPAALLHADLVDRLFLGRGYHPISHAGRYHAFVLEGISLRLLVDVEREPFTTSNVVGLVPGRDTTLRHEYLVVSARLDGDAGDRATGMDGDHGAATCAVVLEAAAALAAHPPRRSVLFVLFTAGAGGSWGARHFLAHPPVPRDDVVAAIHVAGLDPAAGTHCGLELRTPAALRSIVDGAVRPTRNGPVATRVATAPPTQLMGAAAVFGDAGIPSLELAQGATDAVAAPAPADTGDPCAGPAPARAARPRSELRRLRDAARLVRTLVTRLADVSGPGTAPR